MIDLPFGCKSKVDYESEQFYWKRTKRAKQKGKISVTLYAHSFCLVPPILFCVCVFTIDGMIPAMNPFVVGHSFLRHQDPSCVHLKQLHHARRRPVPTNSEEGEGNREREEDCGSAREERESWMFEAILREWKDQMERSTRHPRQQEM